MSESPKPVKIWKCKNCDIYFLPKPPVFSCPNCNSDVTAPTKDQVNESQLWREEIPVIVNCPKCNAQMLQGFTVQSDDWGQLLTWSGGVYWSPDETGFLVNRVPLKAYACPNCGYVETYIRYSRDRERLKMK